MLPLNFSTNIYGKRVKIKEIKIKETEQIKVQMSSSSDVVLKPLIKQCKVVNAVYGARYENFGLIDTSSLSLPSLICPVPLEFYFLHQNHSLSCLFQTHVENYVNIAAEFSG